MLRPVLHTTAICLLLASGAFAAVNPQAQKAKASDGERGPPPPGCIRIAGEDLCARPEAEVAAQLFEQGPQLSPSSKYFAVQGFVRSGWPVAVDFMPQPNTRTELVVALYEPRLFYSPRETKLIMDPDGTGGRQLYQIRIELPDEAVAVPSGSVRIASFSIVSQQLKPNGKVSKKRLPVEVYGIAAGPSGRGAGALYSPGDYDQLRTPGSLSGSPYLRHAALFDPPLGGTLAVTEVELGDGPAPISLGRQGPIAVPYRYVLRERFDLVRDELWRHRCGLGCPKVVFTTEVKRARGPGGGQWTLGNAGTYRLNIRAWMHCDNADYRLCASKAAWQTGRAGPLVVQK